MTQAPAHASPDVQVYLAPSVQAAVARARRELGPEAVLLSSRRAGQDSRMYTVEFGKPAIRPPRTAAPAPESRPATSPQPAASLSTDHQPAPLALPSQPATLRDRLAASGIPASIAAAIVESASRRLAARADSGEETAAAFEQAVRAELELRLKVNDSLGTLGAGRDIVALVGPAGHGKTSSIVKLAVTGGIRAGRPVVVFAAGTQPIGAAEQARALAHAFSFEFHVTETVDALARAIARRSRGELIFIDTPGFRVQDPDPESGLSRFLAHRADIDTHLTLMASLKSVDMRRVIDRFEVFRPAKLLFTRLDETDSLAATAAEAIRTGKALSFYGVGSRIPDDLRPALRERTLHMLLSNPPAAPEPRLARAQRSS
jgi:flagellar biosynthesis protein FlhF